MGLSAFCLNCTSKPSPEPSSTQQLLDEISRAMRRSGVQTSSARAIELEIKPRATSMAGDADTLPPLLAQVLDADILVLGTPVWSGQTNSVTQRVTQRMQSFVNGADALGRYPSFGRVAVVAAVGNGDESRAAAAELLKVMASVGFTIPAMGAACWVDGAMGRSDRNHVLSKSNEMASVIGTLASNATHLASLLKASPYPGCEAGE